MRAILAVTLLLVAGCGNDDAADETASRQACSSLVNRDLATWQLCMYQDRAGRKEARARSNRDFEDAAGLLLLGGAAALSGYNAGRHHTITCTSIGMITTCD